MEARDVRPTYRDGAPPMGVRGPEPTREPAGYAELCGLLEQAIRHLEGSDFRSASAKLERACDRAASLRGANGAVSGGTGGPPRHTGSRDT